MINFLDLIIILLLCWKGWRGLKNGIIIELGGFVILYLSFIISMHDNNIITQTSNIIMQKLNVFKNIEWIFSFIFIYIILFILLRLINNAVDSLSLGFINKFFGAIFGIIKWWLILNILIFTLLFINNKTPLNTEKHIFNKEMVNKSTIINIMCGIANKYID